MNTNALSNLGYTRSIMNEVQIMENLAKDYEQILEEDTLNQEDFRAITLASDSLAKNIQKSRKSIDFAIEENWRDSLNIQLELLEENVLNNIESGVATSGDDYIRSMYNRKAIYEELALHNVEPEVAGAETKGITFTFRMMDIAYPAILTICLIAFFSSVLCSGFVDGMDLEDMFPVNQITWQIKKVCICFLMGIFLYLVWLSISFVIATLMNGVGSINYPITLHSDNYTDTSPVISVITDAFILQALTILFLVLFVYLIAILTKNQLSTLFISSVTIIGLVLLTGNIAPLGRYLHLFPTTYFNATRVITQQLANENNNTHISLTNGILILIVSCIIIMGIILLIKKWHQSNHVFNRPVSSKHSGM